MKQKKKEKKEKKKFERNKFIGINKGKKKLIDRTRGLGNKNMVGIQNLSS